MACRVADGPRPREMDPTEAAYLAGLIEGEGWIARHGTSAALHVAMTDHDVVNRLHRLTGVGVVRMKTPQPNRKPVYVWAVNGVPTLVGVLRQIRPWLGRRRGDRADEWLREYPEYH